ncbi:hypothetical protein FA10DRAFT_231180 [Acaromyces ingoldii]|uniref:RRM domain-containing protein n=1 Tax=Acaromyces ingoldii TaxID=215250 RepID=A0A316YKA5_9BASI|nr:hypothetical protein FA10DRAFT_231180 [Acaromyces ingoldii]PWN89612.1 hypothetical protein FA10DRAFT_231180 [Acaromyces ingoldii]
MGDEEEKPATDALPADANETIYVKNLNEGVKIDVLKKSLEALFSTYGPVLSVTAHSNLRMRGQAFIAFDNKEAAAKAIKEVVGFPLYGKPMQLAFAKTKSDAVVAKLNGGEESEASKKHKEARLEQKKRTRRGNEHRRRELAEKIAAKRAAAGETDGAAVVPAHKKQAIPSMPDEYLPPNKILFIHNVPEAVMRDDLDGLFRQYPGLIDVRVIPGRNVAFVEFTDSASSAVARDGLNNYNFGGSTEKLRITFAK